MTSPPCAHNGASVNVYTGAVIRANRYRPDARIAPSEYVAINMIRVLHVTNAPFTIKQFLAGQTSFMRDHGVEIHIATRPGGLAGEYDADGIHALHGVTIARDIRPFEDVAAILQLRRLISRLRPHIVHGHTPKGGLLAMLAASATPAASIYHCRGLAFTTSRGVHRRVMRTAEHTAFRLADHVFCISPSLRRLVLEEQLCRPEKIGIPGKQGSGNGIDMREFDPDRFVGARAEVRARFGIPVDAPVIGFVGRLIREKGIHELVEAFALLKRSLPGLHLLVVGPFDERDPIAPAVKELMEHSPDIHLAGYQSKTTPFYAAMDVLAFPSYREGFGVVALEAGAMRVPVVATRVTGCVDAIVDGQTGTLVEPRAVEPLSAALATYLRDPALRELHGRVAREYVANNFEQKRLWQDILDTYHSLLSKRS